MSRDEDQGDGVEMARDGKGITGKSRTRTCPQDHEEVGTNELIMVQAKIRRMEESNQSKHPEMADVQVVMMADVHDVEMAKLVSVADWPCLAIMWWHG